MTVSVVKIDCRGSCPLRYAAEGQVYSAGLLLVCCVDEVADDLALDDIYAADYHDILDLFSSLKMSMTDYVWVIEYLLPRAGRVGCQDVKHKDDRAHKACAQEIGLGGPCTQEKIVHRTFSFVNNKTTLACSSIPGTK